VADLGPNLGVEVDKVSGEYILDMIVVNSFEKFKEVNTQNIVDLGGCDIFRTRELSFGSLWAILDSGQQIYRKHWKIVMCFQKYVLFNQLINLFQDWHLNRCKYVFLLLFCQFNS